MDQTEAYDVLAGMTHLKFFPQQRQAVDNLAALLVELSKGHRARAEWLVRECASTLDEYPGPATMRAMMCNRFPPEGSAYATYEPDTYRGRQFNAEELAEFDADTERIMAKIRVEKSGEKPAVERPPERKPTPIRQVTDADFEALGVPLRRNS